VQETRLWDAAASTTHSMRGKEEAHDYRYFPDPDLVALAISNEWIEEVSRPLPELPLEKRERFVRDYGIPSYDAGVLTGSRALADFYEETVRLSGRPKAASNWVMGDFLRYLNEEKKSVAESLVTPATLAGMIALIEKGTISGKIAKEVFEEMWKTGNHPVAVIGEKGLTQITDEGALTKTIEEVLAVHAKQVEEYRSGKEAVFGYLVGQVMKATRGKANPQLVNDLLRKKLQTP